MDARAIFDRVAAQFGDAVYDYKPGVVGNDKTNKGFINRDNEFKCKAERLVEVMTFLRDDAELRMDFLMCLTGVDYIKEKLLQSVYHLFSYPLRHQICVKVDLPRDKPEVPSVVGVWITADWNEREQYDLLGIIYTGHPDLRRLLMPDDWVGHPMRKDYKEAEMYRDMPTSRYSPLEMLSVYDKAHVQVSTDPNVPGGRKAQASDSEETND